MLTFFKSFRVCFFCLSLVLSVVSLFSNHALALDFLPQFEGKYFFQADYVVHHIQQKKIIHVRSNEARARVSELRNEGYFCQSFPRMMVKCTKFIRSDISLPSSLDLKLKQMYHGSFIEFNKSSFNWEQVNYSEYVKQWQKKQTVHWVTSLNELQVESFDFYLLKGLSKIKIGNHWINIIDDQLSYFQGPFSFDKKRSSFEESVKLVWVSFPLR